MVFEKEFTNICRGWPIQFENPDKNMLKHIKELIEYRENLIDTNTLPAPFWWNDNPHAVVEFCFEGLLRLNLWGPAEGFSREISRACLFVNDECVFLGGW